MYVSGDFSPLCCLAASFTFALSETGEDDQAKEQQRPIKPRTPHSML